MTLHRRSIKLIYFALALALLSILFVQAATQNAIITGSVFDQGGTPVANATVRLWNTSTGFERTQTTDNYGTYTFANVPPAENYIVSVEASGFATVTRPGLTVAVGDAKLVLPAFFVQPAAQAGAQVEEKGEERTVSIDLVSATLGGVIDTRSVRALPLANRDFLDLALLIPGTYPVEQGSELEGASLVVNGVRANMNNFLLEGADNNDYTINQSLPFQLVEALQEFRVQSSTSTPEFGRNAGAQINSVSRSGGNEFHGTLFWFNRNDALNADNALSHHRGGTLDAFAQAARVDEILFGAATFFPDPVLSDPMLSRIYQDGRETDLNQNQFGANLGGPVMKDKLFFFFNWESFRADNDRPIFERVPGTFFRDPAFIFDPSTALANALFNTYPEPNVPASTVTDSFGNPVSDPDFGDVFLNAALFAGESANFTDTDNYLGRMDWRVSGRANMSFKYNAQRIRQEQGGSLPRTASYGGNGARLTGVNQNFSYNYLHQVSDRALNEFRFGWNRFRLNTDTLDRSTSSAVLLHNVDIARRGFPVLLIGGFESTFGPFANLGSRTPAPTQRANNVWSWADNGTLTWGRHVLKAGVEIRHNRLNATNESLARGLLTFFSVGFVAAFGEPDLASVARVSPDFGGGFDRSFSANSFDWYVQDTWRPRSNVSLTYGIRHEINQAPREARDRLVNNYPGACPQLICLIRSGTSDLLDTDGSSLGSADFRAPRAGFDTDYNNIGPRVGLAWDPWSNGKSVLRAGYAVTFDQQSLQPSVNMLFNPPFVQQWASFFPFFLLGDVFPPGFPTVPVDILDLDGDTIFSIWLRQPYSITARDPGTRTSYVHQFHLSVQQQVGRSSFFEVAYVGSAGHKLPRLRLLLECTQDILTDPATTIDCLPGGFFGGSGASSDSIVQQENSANSNFHSLQLRWETRNLRGLTLRLHYLWSHSIDSASSANAPLYFFSPTSAGLLANFFQINSDQFAALNTVSPTLSLRPGLPIITTRPLVPSDTLNSSQLDERASSDFDVRHRFIVSYIYDVPRWAPGIGSGWQLAGITTVQSGQPFTAFVDFFGIPLRPTFRQDPEINRSDPDRALDGATVMGLPDSAFGVSAAVQGLSANTGRNAFEGPGLVNFDFSILKNTYLGAGERVNLQFRVEFFNLFNHPNFRQPFSQSGVSFNDGISGSFTPNPFYGLILQARAGREIQFGLKLIF